METKSLSFEQMENLDGGSWACAGNLVLLGLAGATAAVATGGWFLVAGFAYIVQVRDTSIACLGAE